MYMGLRAKSFPNKTGLSWNLTRCTLPIYYSFKCINIQQVRYQKQSQPAIYHGPKFSSHEPALIACQINQDLMI